MRVRTLCRVAFALALLVIAGASLAPMAVVGFALDTYDKPAHLAAYFALALLAAMGWPRWRTVVLIGLPLVGLAMEAAQGATGRSFDWVDALANAGGIGVAVALSFVFTRWMDRRE